MSLDLSRGQAINQSNSASDKNSVVLKAGPFPQKVPTAKGIKMATSDFRNEHLVMLMKKQL